ncbi:hypothetical protein CVT26_015787, partial [Gymnopilus dilepis]
MPPSTSKPKPAKDTLTPASTSKSKPAKDGSKDADVDSGKDAAIDRYLTDASADELLRMKETEELESGLRRGRIEQAWAEKKAREENVAGTK